MNVYAILLKLSIVLVFSFERLYGQELPDISSIPADIAVPDVMFGDAFPGLRVKQTTPGWEHSDVYHILYLPKNWKAASTLPVIAEYAGNGNYQNDYGDSCNGKPESCSLGYGLSGGRDFIWVCLPFVKNEKGAKSNAVKWWGDMNETKRYAAATLHYLAKAFGADTTCVILAGFSRGAIACNYMGLYDDAMASLWAAFFCHSHYDGVYEGWSYPGADRLSAHKRLERLKERPQWISHEGSIKNIQDYLLGTGVKGNFTFQAIPFRNHTDKWVLRDIPQRQAARSWLHEVVKICSISPQ